ncbi:MAG: roadblock/LC7 domain-containing protein [Gemmatimonadota bacterium]
MLRRLVDGLSARPEITGVAVISGEGLVIQQALGPEADPDALAALAMTLGRHGSELGESVGLGALQTLVLEFEDGPAVMTRYRDDTALVLLARPEADLGELLYLLRRQRGAINDLL